MNSNQDLQITIDRLKKLIENEEEDEYGRIVTVNHQTIERATALVSAAALLCSNFFKAWMIIEDNADICLIWSNPTSKREIHVLVPATTDRVLYMYYEEEQKYNSQLDINFQDLSKWIDWVNTNTN